MGQGMSVARASAQLASIFQQTSTAVTALWCQLHVGPPGKAGTSNPAGNTVRMEATTCFGTDPVDNLDGTVTITNDTLIGPWVSVSTTEVYTHYTMWDDETAGSFEYSGEVADGTVTAGDNWDAQPGTCSSTYAAAS